MPIPEGAARRRYPRYQLAVPFDLTVFRPGSVVRLSGSAHDIGEGGLSGVISGAALSGERVELTILLPTSPKPLSMRAIVRHQADLHCGLEFLSLEHGQLEQLQRLAAEPGLRASLINETECEPSLEPGPRDRAALCAVCGQELPDEIPVCLTCGTPQTPEAAVEPGEPHAGLAAEPAPSAAPVLLTAKKEPARRRGPVLDSVVAIIFLVTLTIGLWQWLQSPADAGSQPSPVTVELENVFLRPPTVTKASRAERSSTSGALTAAKSLVSAVIGGASADDQQAAVGSPGSAAAESGRRRQERPVSNSSSNSPARSAPAENPPALPSPALSAPAAASAASNLLAQSSSAGQGSSAPSAPASEAPSSSDLAGMLLQKVLPVYPAAARRQGVQGQVVLKAVIGKDGTIAELRPLQGPQELTAAAMDAVQHWRFRPYQLKGKPVEVETDIRLNFQLPPKK